MLTDKISRWLMRTVPNFGCYLNSEMPIALGSDIGLTRKENQDRLGILRVNSNSSNGRSFVAVALADGMGGMCDGSECAARTLGAFFNALILYRKKSPDDRLSFAAKAANDAVHQYSNANGGATLSAVLFDTGNKVFTVNVGDSRIYAVNRNNPESEVARLTVDDSLEEAVGGHGRELLQFIGMGEGLIPHVSAVPESIDKIAITSDGVHFLSHALLSDILIHTASQVETAEQLLTVAKWRGGPDNASIAVVSKDGLLKHLNLNHESGVEVWDPFGTLQVMWLKQESPEPVENVVLSNDGNESPKSQLEKPAPDSTSPKKTIYKKPSNEKKDKMGKKSRQKKLDQDPQIEIVIETTTNSSAKDGMDSDNS
jgi:serine/threonine protein phosphatase PrpC